jgi:Domain of unknown function (DUF4439)
VTDWQPVLTAEQTAVFGYGGLGPHLTLASSVSLARTCQLAHQVRAIQAAAGLTASGAVAQSGPSDYQLAIPVDNNASAVQLAIQLEEGTAAAWRYLLVQLAATSSQPGNAATRGLALAALTESAVHAVQWRRMLTPTQASVPFPGI